METVVIVEGAIYGIKSMLRITDAAGYCTVEVDEQQKGQSMNLKKSVWIKRNDIRLPSQQEGLLMVVKVKDLPQLDPVGVLLGKIDKETNQNKPG